MKNKTTTAALSVLILSFLISCVSAPASAAESFSRIDQEVRNLPAERQRSITELSTALENIAGSDREKTRALYIWITDNIAYDTDSFFQGISGPTDAEGTFRSRKSVCEGYAGLFLEIGTRLGLEVVKIHGYAKGWGYREGLDPGGTNHAWNAVRIDGKWHLFDATWGAGHVNGRDFIRDYSEFYFDTPPEEFVFTHFPENSDFQLLSGPVSRRDFFRLPRLDGDDFGSGVDAEAVMDLVDSGKEFGMPVIYSTDFPAVLVEFPMVSELKAGRTYRIVIETEAPYALIKDGNGRTDTIAARRGRFVIQRKYSPGKMGIFLAPLEARDMYSHSYGGFLAYEVR